MDRTKVMLYLRSMPTPRCATKCVIAKGCYKPPSKE